MMREFFVKVLLFCGLSFCCILPVEYHKINNVVSAGQINPEVYKAIENSHTKVAKRKYLILGDSMGMQLYPCTDNYVNAYSLSCNQAIMLAGHYFLLNNFIETNGGSLPDKVILIYNPKSFRNNTDKYTFHYFLKPFYTEEYKGLYSNSLSDAIMNIPFYWLSQFPFVKTSSWSVDYQPNENLKYCLLSPVSSDYLKKMISLLKEKGVDFSIIAPPLSEKNKDDYERFWSEGLKNGEYSGFEDVMINYHESFKYFPDSLFEDSIHLYDRFIPIDYLKIDARPSGCSKYQN